MRGMRMPMAGWRGLVLLLAIGFGLTATHALPAETPSRTSFDDQLDKWLEDLAHADAQVRRRAYKSLCELPEWRITLPRANRILLAATRQFPARAEETSADEEDDELEYDEFAHLEVAEGLIGLVARNPRDEHIETLEGCFEKYSPAARSQAMLLLGMLETEHAARVAVELIRKYGANGGIATLHLWAWHDLPEYAKVFFPALLQDAADPELEEEILMLLDNYLEMAEMPLEVIEQSEPELLKLYRRHKIWLLPFQRAGVMTRFYAEDYIAQRDPACQALSILGHLPHESARQELRQAMEFSDPQLKLAAAMVLLERGEPVPGEVLEQLATRPESRYGLFDALQENNMLSLFPTRYMTQCALAESELVSWLVNARQAGPPRQVELVKVVSVDPQTNVGILDFYVFRFCMTAPAPGEQPDWKAGVAGPYPRSIQPSTFGGAGAYSQFEGIDDKWPEEHVGNLHEIIQEYRRRAGIME